jgi:ABC transporter with metal-binding/Fe-S-binding domain ATP-binding protein
MPFKHGQNAKGAKMRAALFSGGKDSTLALHKANAEKPIELLITMVPANEDSYMFHKADIMYTKLQASAMGMQQRMVATEGKKEDELADLEKALVEYGVSELVTGATSSEYQRKRIDNICNRHGIRHIAPLWHINPIDELKELSVNYKVIITKVAAEGFDDSYLGALIDEQMVEKLFNLNRKYGINMLFEGGEAESFVLDAPLFKKKIKIIKAHPDWQGMVGNYVIDKAVLVDKE